MSRTVTIRSLPEAFALIKEMQGEEYDWGEGYRRAGRRAVAEVLEAQAEDQPEADRGFALVELHFLHDGEHGTRSLHLGHCAEHASAGHPHPKFHQVLLLLDMRVGVGLDLGLRHGFLALGVDHLLEHVVRYSRQRADTSESRTG